MDSIRTFFRVMWQQRFWVLTVTSVLIASLCWMSAASDIDEEFKTELTKVKGKFSGVDNINRAEFHGNDQVNEKDREETRVLRKRVLELWTSLFDAQKEQVLYWPEVLSPGFINHIKDKQFDAKISNKYRSEYRNYIEDRFEGLLEIVKAPNDVGDLSAAGGGGGYGGGEYGGGEYGGGAARRRPTMGEEDGDYLVQWLDQSQVAQKMQFAGLPSSRQIWVTQEDLWVYQTLLKVIADTNQAKGATRPDNTAISTIIQLEVGQKAASVNKGIGSILMPAADAGGGGEYGGGEFGGGEYGGGGEFGGGGYGGGEYGGGEYGGGEFGGGEYGGRGGSAGDEELLAGRYVDNTGAPIQATSVEELGKTFRRLPIRMVLEMDQRWIPKVLVECANASLPVEVKRLRVNPEKSGEGFGSTSGGARGGGEYGGNFRNRGGATPGAMRDLANVEILGVVSIYFQPQDDQIPGSGEEEDLADASTTTVK